jgi:hypothetical protein
MAERGWRRAPVVLLLAIPSGAPAAAGAEQADDPRKPISSSIPRVIDRLSKEWDAPCAAAVAAGVPCFPVWVAGEPPPPSPPEWLRDPKPGTAPVPSRPPTSDEIRQHLSGTPGPFVPFASFDPVCTGKSILKALKGKNDVYYLYRVTDRSGERMALYDRELNPASYLSVPEVSFEFLGKFEGECEAVAAYRRAVRRGAAAVRGKR